MPSRAHTGAKMCRESRPFSRYKFAPRKFLPPMVPPDPVPVSLSDLSPDSLLRDVVSAYLEHYLVTRVLRKKMRETTRRHYARRLTPGHLRWLASLPISRIKHCTVLQWHEELEADSATSSLADNVVYAVDPGARVLAERFDAVLRTVRAGRRGGDA